MKAVAIFGFIMYSLIIWCWSGSIWYDNGFKDGYRKATKNARNK